MIRAELCRVKYRPKSYMCTGNFNGTCNYCQVSSHIAAACSGEQLKTRKRPLSDKLKSTSLRGSGVGVTSSSGKNISRGAKRVYACARTPAHHHQLLLYLHILIVFFFFSTANVVLVHFNFSPHTSTFQLLNKPWSQVSSLLALGSCLQFVTRIGFSNPTARRFFIKCF